MTIHVGIYPYFGKVLYYDDTKRFTNNVEIEKVEANEKEKVVSMFEEIKSKIKGEQLGCLCFCLYNSYGNEIRKSLIEIGLKYGFKNVEIINWWQDFYLSALSQINYKPLNGNIICIKWGRFSYVWQISDPKAKYICTWETDSIFQFENIVNESNLKPNIVLSEDNIWFANIKQILKTCKFFTYDLYNDRFSKGSILKARITAGDENVAHLDLENFLCSEIALNYGGEKITSFSKGPQLPIFYTLKLPKKPNYVLEIISKGFVYFRQEFFYLPRKGIKQFTLTIDKNEIYSVTFEDEDSNICYPMSEKNFVTTDLKLNSLQQQFQPPSSNNKNYVIPKLTLPLNSKMNAIGIDLGTSRSCAAGLKANAIQAIALDNTGERLLPSYVAFDEENVKCGRIVVSRLRYHSKSTIFDSKRIIGRKFGDIEIDENWQFNVNSENDKVYLEVIGFNGERKKITAEEVATELLKFIKQKAEELQGSKLGKVGITVPAAFNEAQKNATLEAAKMAGWDEIILLPEPIAAAFAYFVDQPISNNSTLLLFDLGGGTWDVCIFKILNDQIQIISNTGDSKLGGRNFDTVLMNFFKNAFYTKNGISIEKDKIYKLMLECQRVKEDLSSISNSSIAIDEFDPNGQGVISISQEEFQKIAQVLLKRISNTLNAALFDANLKPNQINKVFQVGGGSRMPMIKTLLKDIFPFAEHCCKEHPDEVVAIGAAYYAYSIFNC